MCIVLSSLAGSNAKTYAEEPTQITPTNLCNNQRHLLPTNSPQESGASLREMFAILSWILVQTDLWHSVYQHAEVAVSKKSLIERTAEKVAQQGSASTVGMYRQGIVGGGGQAGQPKINNTPTNRHTINPSNPLTTPTTDPTKPDRPIINSKTPIKEPRHLRDSLVLEWVVVSGRERHRWRWGGDRLMEPERMHRKSSCPPIRSPLIQSPDPTYPIHCVLRGSVMDLSDPRTWNIHPSGAPLGRMEVEEHGTRRCIRLEGIRTDQIGSERVDRVRGNRLDWIGPSPPHNPTNLNTTDEATPPSPKEPNNTTPQMPPRPARSGVVNLKGNLMIHNLPTKFHATSHQDTTPICYKTTNFHRKPKNSLNLPQNSAQTPSRFRPPIPFCDPKMDLTQSEGRDVAIGFLQQW
ncbi:hypothetical protein BDK51DRAFT_25667, partial [Blyttiomyces helicus]